MTTLCLRTAVALMATLGLVATGSFAHAALPDPSWVAGVYDDADFDDVVMTLTSTAGVLDACPVAVSPPSLVVQRPSPVVEPGGPSALPLPAWQIRAPPLA
jgi:hypothetical protein